VNRGCTDGSRRSGGAVLRDAEAGIAVQKGAESMKLLGNKMRLNSLY